SLRSECRDHPHAFCFPIGLLDVVQKTVECGAVTGIAIHHFVGQRETIGGDHQLQTIRPFIPAATVLGLSALFNNYAPRDRQPLAKTVLRKTTGRPGRLSPPRPTAGFSPQSCSCALKPSPVNSPLTRATRFLA